jgi:hypothetical protein
MNAIAQNMTDSAYAQLLALRNGHYDARECVDMTIDSLMEQYQCSRRRAALVTTKAWADLEATGKPPAYVDASLTTGNTVVIHDASGRTNIFSVHELLQLRDSQHNTINRINA